MNQAKTFLTLLGRILLLPYFIVHYFLEQLCVAFARSFCRRKGLTVSQYRVGPFFDCDGYKTEFSLVELDCLDPQQRRLLVRLKVWVFGVRKTLSIDDFPDEAHAQSEEKEEQGQQSSEDAVLTPTNQKLNEPRFPHMKKILMLEDMPSRIDAFREAVAELPNVELLIWRSAPEMIRDLPQHLPSASLISLDHDLLPSKGSQEDPGTGLDVCEFLAKQGTRCTVFLHTSNYIKVWSMMNELTYAKWDVHRTPPVGIREDWIKTVWLPRVKEVLSSTQTG